MDVGLAVNGLGVRAGALLAESLELCPPAKLLFSTDAVGLPELYHLGAHLFRRSLGGLLDTWVAEGAWTPADAERVAQLVASGNARRVYGLKTGEASSP